MDSAEELQQLEITALRSIYDKDFILCPPPTVWKGAARLHEFIIKVYHPDPQHAPKINLLLHVKFPKTYPNLAGPIFSLEKPITGLSDSQVTKLSHEVNLQVQKLRGSEMVFTIVTFCQDWIDNNITPPPEEVLGSLAVQMNQRALDQERVRHEREMEEAEREKERAIKAAQELDEQIQADAMRQLMAKEQQYKARKRANSEATEVPFIGEGDFQVPTEVFSHEMEIDGVLFNAVKLFHPRSAGLGIVYTADPIVDEIVSTSPLELYVVTFESQYYTTTQGRKKLKQVEQEIQKLTTVRHPKLITVFAVKLYMPHSSGPPQLMVLSEQLPALTLHDVLEDSDFLREDRVSDYIGQILTALNAIHISDFVHRGINTQCIGLAPRESIGQPKAIKLGKVAYHTRLLDLHRSNSFGPHTPVVQDEYQVPEAWLSRVQNESSLLYTRQRDIHAVGIVLLQMLMGLDVMERFPDAQTAIHASSISALLARQALNMLQPYRKNHVTCMSLLSELAEGTSRTPSINRTLPSPSDVRTPLQLHIGSPDPDYFRVSGMKTTSSRWKEDWEELELLGKGAFGSVVKARNKIDSRIYAVKKIRLRTMQSDTKIFREVNALSRLSHRNIVRYYTTWVETSDSQSTAASDDSSSEFVIEDGRTSVPETSERHLPINGGFYINIEDFDDLSGSRSSFPSIHFGRSSSPGTTSGEDSSEDDGFGSLFRSASSGSVPSLVATPTLSRTLYIQMEFVERQTLKELVNEGISEDEAWRLFLQVVDALSHMSTHTILHRDIKLTNIFIDAQGDCKVGDFGLATSSLAAVDPSDVSPHAVTLEADMTLEVGTRLYIAPEVQSRKRGPRNHSKADMYSLGIVFFEMNYTFTTGAERIAVLEDIRKPGIYFPSDWDAHRTRQREIITLLLQHEPDKRPTALELSQSTLLPSRLEDEYFKGALRMMAKPDSPHHQTVLNSLFKQPPRPSRAYLYDIEADPSEYASLNNIVKDRLAAIFHLHGAVDMEPPLLMPALDPEEEKSQATFIDRHGDVVTLPNNILVPFARLAARGSIKRIKRFHIANVFRPNPVAGHPKVLKAAVFDIISQDLEYGAVAAGAEIIAVASDCLDSFPNLAQNYDIHISHSKLVQIAMNRVTADARSSVVEIILQSKSTFAQKRVLLLKKGLPRTTVDELEILSEVEEDIDDILARLEKASPTLSALMQPAVKEIKSTIQYSQAANLKRPIFFHPLMLGSHHTHFKDGILVEVVKRHKHTDVLAAGGRYDSLISRLSQLKPKPEPICALGIQIAVEKITAALASYQNASLKTLVKEERSFGFWSPRRCDVYVVSYQAGYLQDRLEVVSFLWQHNISADLMYESGLPDGDHENHLDICAREGILFTVYPRARNVRNLPAFKVKSILKGTEVDLSRQELVGWLQHQIADQKRVDATTSGAQNHLLETAPNFPVIKDTAVIPEVHLVLPDQKKQRKPVRQILVDKAFEKAVAIKTSFQNGMPVLAVDVTQAQFEVMTRTSSWIIEEEAWKSLSALFQQSQMNYALTVREAAMKRKSEGHSYILLFAVREDRAQLLSI